MSSLRKSTPEDLFDFGIFTKLEFNDLHLFSLGVERAMVNPSNNDFSIKYPAMGNLKINFNQDEKDLKDIQRNLKILKRELTEISAEDFKRLDAGEIRLLIGKVESLNTSYKDEKTIFQRSMRFLGFENKKDLSKDLVKVSEALDKKIKESVDGFLKNKKYSEAIEAAGDMKPGKERDNLFRSIGMKALEGGKFHMAMMAVANTEPGIDRNVFLDVIRKLKEEKYVEAAARVGNTNFKLREIILVRALEKKEYDKSLEILTTFSVSKDRIPDFLRQFVYKNKFKLNKLEKELLIGFFEKVYGKNLVREFKFILNILANSYPPLQFECSSLLEKEEYEEAVAKAKTMSPGYERDGFLEAIGMKALEANDFELARKAANEMRLGYEKDDLLEAIGMRALEANNFEVAKNSAGAMKSKERMEDLLEVLWMKALEDVTDLDPFIFLNLMKPGEKKEVLVEITQALKDKRYIEAAKSAKNRGLELLAIIMVKTLESKEYENFLEVLKITGFSKEEMPLFLIEFANKNGSKLTEEEKGRLINVIKGFYKEGPSRSSFESALISSVVNDFFENGKYSEAIGVVEGVEPGEKRDNLCVLIGTKFLNAREYDKCLEVLKIAGFSKEEVPSFLIEFANKNRSKLTEEEKGRLINVIKGFYKEGPSLSFFKYTLVLPVPSEKGLAIPVSLQSIPKPDPNTTLEDLNNLNIISQVEDDELSNLKTTLGLNDISLETWLSLYDTPESQRVEKGRFTGDQKIKLRALTPEDLSKFWNLQGKKIIEDGCKDLYTRIQTQASLWNPGDPTTVNERAKIIYGRMAALVTHLVHYAKTVPEDRETLLFLLAGSVGRCEGVLTEFETLYRRYCLKESDSNSIDAALENKGYFIRQGIIDKYVNESELLRDVHKNTVFKNLIASKTGTVPFLEGESEKAFYYREYAERQAPFFLRDFPVRYAEEFSKTLLEILLDTKSQEKIKVGEEFESFSELVLKDMETLGCFGDLSEALQSKKEQVLDALKEGEIKAPEGFEAGEVIGAIRDESPEAFKRIMILEPLYREKLTKEVVMDYLVKKGFFKDPCI